MADEKNPLANLGKAPEAKPAETQTRAPRPETTPAARQTLREQGGAASLKNHPVKPINGSSQSLDGGDEPAERWSSHPVANFRIGRFRFDRGLLNLDAQDAEEFNRIYEQLPVTEQRRVTKLDVNAAERFLADRAAQRSSSATKQFDSSVGERAGATPVGTEELGHASRSQMDANQVVDVTTGEAPPAEETAGKVVPHEA